MAFDGAAVRTTNRSSACADRTSLDLFFGFDTFFVVNKTNHVDWR
jgi:hypothetical protein